MGFGWEAGREALEGELRRRYDCEAVLLTDSGTSALQVALAAAGSGGARVALPAYCCYDIATAATGAGCRAVLYDVDPATLGPDRDSVQRALERGAGVVVAAHLYGYPVDVTMLSSACSQANAVLVEDAAQGVGGAFRGRSLGSWGSLSVLSFGRGKGVTGGGGGALLAHDARGAGILSRARERIGPWVRGMRNLGVLVAQWMLARPGFYALPSSIPFLHLGETVFRSPGRPRAAAPVSVAAARDALELSRDESATRRRNTLRLLHAARQGRGVDTVRALEGGEPGYLRLPVLLSPDRERNVRAERRLGIMPGYPRVLHQLEGFAEAVENRDVAFPGARTLTQRLVTLPTHGLLGEGDLIALERWLSAAA